MNALMSLILLVLICLGNTNIGLAITGVFYSIISIGGLTLIGIGSIITL